MRRFLTLGWLCMALLGLSLGCSGSMSASQVQTAQVLFDEAFVSESNAKTEEAFAKIEAAMTQGGLRPDQLAEAYLLRARCHSASGNLDSALADLEMAEQGAPNPSIWHFSRGIYFSAKGEATKSKSEFALARKLDPSLKIPK